jgi:hypothetical protein
MPLKNRGHLTGRGYLMGPSADDDAPNASLRRLQQVGAHMAEYVGRGSVTGMVGTSAGKPAQTSAAGSRSSAISPPKPSFG